MELRRMQYNTPMGNVTITETITHTTMIDKVEGGQYLTSCTTFKVVTGL